MKKNRRKKSITTSNSRWLAYATAAAASAVAGARTAEAEIHYSGLVRAEFDSHGRAIRRAFPLNSGASLQFRQFCTSGRFYGSAQFGVRAAVSNKIRAYSQGGFVYVEKLASGEVISQGHFSHIHPLRAFLGTSYDGGQFTEPGIGFIGFGFDNGKGTQYGWARINSSGHIRDSFRLVDYAWADPGEPIRAGQTSSAGDMVNTVTESGSLGALALGAAGLIAWRKRRATAAVVGSASLRATLATQSD